MLYHIYIFTYYIQQPWNLRRLTESRMPSTPCPWVCPGWAPVANGHVVRSWIPNQKMWPKKHPAIVRWIYPPVI